VGETVDTEFLGSYGTVFLGDSFDDHVIPLFLCLAIQKGNDDDGHIIASVSASVARRGETIIHEILTDFVEFLSFSDASPDKLDDLCIRKAIPDS
jgi:hypothetical protein